MQNSNLFSYSIICLLYHFVSYYIPYIHVWYAQWLWRKITLSYLQLPWPSYIACRKCPHTPPLQIHLPSWQHSIFHKTNESQHSKILLDAQLRNTLIYSYISHLSEVWALTTDSMFKARPNLLWWSLVRSVCAYKWCIFLYDQFKLFVKKVQVLFCTIYGNTS